MLQETAMLAVFKRLNKKQKNTQLNPRPRGNRSKIGHYLTGQKPNHMTLDPVRKLIDFFRLNKPKSWQMASGLSNGVDLKLNFVLNCQVALRLVPSNGTVGRQHNLSDIYPALLPVFGQSKVGGKTL